MPAQPFDLAGTASDLLTRIRKRNDHVDEVTSAYEKYRFAQEKSDEAGQRMDKLLALPEHSEEELASLNLEILGLNKQLDESWKAYKAATAFTNTFADDLDLLMGRLPSRNAKWQRLRASVAKLRIRRPDAWLDPSINPDLETLEIRLKEVVDFAGRSRTSGTNERIERRPIEPGQNTAPSARPKAKRGPPPKVEIYRKVVKAVSTKGSTWGDEKNLDDVCRNLDRLGVPVPTPWRVKKPSARTWARAASGYSPRVVRQAVKDRLKMAEKHCPEFSETLRNLL